MNKRKLIAMKRHLGYYLQSNMNTRVLPSIMHPKHRPLRLFS
jgi:hypothetical protein